MNMGMMTIVKRKIWDMILLFVITNGFGGAVLLAQDMWARGTRRLAGAAAGRCAA